MNIQGIWNRHVGNYVGPYINLHPEARTVVDPRVWSTQSFDAMILLLILEILHDLCILYYHHSEGIGYLEWTELVVSAVGNLVRCPVHE